MNWRVNQSGRWTGLLIRGLVRECVSITPLSANWKVLLGRPATGLEILGIGNVGGSTPLPSSTFVGDRQ